MAAVARIASRVELRGIRLLDLAFATKTIVANRVTLEPSFETNCAPLPSALQGTLIEAMSVLVSVGFSVPCIDVHDAAREEAHGRSLNTGHLRCAAFSCAALQNGFGRIMSPLL
jgi:hypothetical protein